MRRTATTAVTFGAVAGYAGATVSPRCRHAELLLNCARIGFNP